MLVALAAIWGSSFMFIKVAVRELTPGEVVFGRVLVGTLTLLAAVPFMVGWRRLGSELRRFALPLIVIGTFNASLPFWLLAWSEKRLDSGLAAVLQASTPLFTALFAFGFSRGDRVTGGRLVGVFIGFLGVLLLVGAQPSGDVLSALAVLGTAACYAGSALFAGVRMRGLHRS
jgi:drug/metabolite transporter (DMT)-like permease